MVLGCWKPQARLILALMRRPTAAIATGAFFLAAPCVVAGLVPWLIGGWRPACR